MRRCYVPPAATNHIVHVTWGGCFQKRDRREFWGVQIILVRQEGLSSTRIFVARFVLVYALALK